MAEQPGDAPSPRGVLNVAAYRFVAIDDPAALAARLRERAAARDLRGTILVAPEGLNLFLAGHDAPVDAFLAELAGDARFAELPVRRSRSEAVPFRRLKVRVEREIITFGQPGAAPLDGWRAATVDAATLARWLDRGHDDDGRPLRLLDTRNREEVAHGSFDGATALPIDRFTALPAAWQALRAADPSLAAARLVTFCTGGIRCEKAARWLHDEGAPNVVQLDGGILGYFERAGGAHWRGRCFVFDERVALDPQLRPLVDGVVA